MRPILSSPKFQKAGRALLLLCITTLIAGGILHIVDTQFRARTIHIEGLVKGQTLYGLKSIYNEPLIYMDVEKAAENIKANNPPVSKISITKIYPDNLRIKVSLYTPVAYLQVENGYFLLSVDGRILRRIKDQTLEDLPIIHYYKIMSYEATQPGTYLSLKDLLMALYFSEKTKQLGMRVDTIDIDGVDMIGLNLDGKVILFSSEKEKELQVYQMEQIIRQFRVEGKNFSRMDLRYNKPVLELMQ